MSSPVVTKNQYLCNKHGDHGNISIAGRGFHFCFRAQNACRGREEVCSLWLETPGAMK